MKHLLIAVMAGGLIGCGGSPAVLNTIETTSEKLQPVVDGWKKICQIGRGCLEAAEQDTTELTDICEKGWRVFQTIQAIQETAVEAAGGEPCGNSCNQ